MRDVEELVRDFEIGRLSREDWNHRAHLAVAAYYLTRLPEGEATERMIAGIRRYNHANGIRQTPTGGYHETITLFWLVVTRVTVDAYRTEPVLERINAVVSGFAGRGDLMFSFYSRNRLFSPEARAHWVPPDRCACAEMAAIGGALGGDCH